MKRRLRSRLALWLSAADGEALRRQIGEAAQEERNRLARDLHDSIKQQLFTINVSTAAAQERWDWDPEGARTALADARRSAKEAMVEMQALLHQLRPQALGSIQGLAEALREQCEALGYRTGTQVTVELGPEIPEDRVPPGAREALFRIAQEALANVARHARARQTCLWLGREGDAILLRVDDDGQGFEPGAARPGMGMRNLRERAESLHGTLEVASAPGSGTRLAVRIPLAPVPPEFRGREISGVLQEMAFFALLMIWSHMPSFQRGIMKYETYLYLFLAVFLGWAWLGGRGIQGFPLQRQRALYTFLLAWWPWGLLQNDWPLPMVIVLFCISFVWAIEVIRFHQVSRFRSFREKGARTWLWLILLMETEVLLSLGLPFLKPSLFTPLSPVEVFFLGVAGAGFVYVASRGPRTGEAPA